MFFARASEMRGPSAEGAKLRGRFWVAGAGSVAREPVAASLYPGYAPSPASWGRYFRELFDQTTYLPGVAEGDRRVSASSLGALGLAREQGADALIFGISDSFIPVNPAGLGLPGKVLHVGRGNLLPEAVVWYAGALRGRPKAKLAIWGHSLVYARRDPSDELVLGGVRALYRDWRGREVISRWDYRFPHPSWNLLIGPGLQQSLEFDNEGLLIPDADARDPKRLRAFLEKHDSGGQLIVTGPSACDLGELSKRDDAAIAALLEVADKVLIFLPPTNPVDRRRGPSCLLPTMQNLLRSKAGPRVIVDAADWDAYGLSDRDYLYASSVPGMWKLDPIHANAEGGRKITARLSQAAKAALTPAGKAPGKTGKEGSSPRRK